MKPEIIIQQGLKSANILLKNAQQRAAELDHLKGELVIITDANGKTFKGFFRNVVFVILDNRITARYTVCHILECNGVIMASEHTDEYMTQWIYARHPTRTTDIMFNSINPPLTLKQNFHLIQFLQTVLTLLTSVTVSMDLRF